MYLIRSLPLLLNPQNAPLHGIHLVAQIIDIGLYVGALVGAEVGLFGPVHFLLGPGAAETARPTVDRAPKRRVAERRRISEIQTSQIIINL